MVNYHIEPQKVLNLHKELEKKKPNIHGEYIVTTKKDGWYCFIDYTKEQGWGYIRNENRVIPSFQYARELFMKEIPTPNQDTRFIMEAIIPGVDFHTANGIFNRKSEDAKDAVFIIHDCLFLDTFYMQIQENSAISRMRKLFDTRLPLYQWDEKIALSEITAISKDRNVWNFQFEKAIDAGEEGIILKRVESFYTPGKRNADLMKLKLEETYDLLVKSMYWSTGEKGNDSLNLLLENASGITVPVRVGKDSDIAEFTKESPVGKIAEIRCMKQLEDGSYREPRFKSIRTEKKDYD